ncbi:MAG TPA: cytochrome P450, partial [Acidimicrobiia bacterium]|nr:cytochrome P450 [Acidimicrobiia bacterium]
MDARIDIVSGDFWGGAPHDALTWLRANDPVYFDESHGVWGITRYDDVKAISTQPEVFSNAGGIRPDSGPVPMMIDMDDPEHLARRKLVNRGFTPRRVRDQGPRIRAVADRLIDRVCEQGQCDFVWDIAAWLPLIMIGEALGVDEADHPTLLQWSDDLLRGLGQDDPALLERTMAASVGYAEYATRVIADRRAHARDDLMSVLVHAEIDGDRLDDQAL